MRWLVSGSLVERLGRFVIYHRSSIIFNRVASVRFCSSCVCFVRRKLRHVSVWRFVSVDVPMMDRAQGFSRLYYNSSLIKPIYSKLIFSWASFTYTVIDPHRHLAQMLVRAPLIKLDVLLSDETLMFYVRVSSY